MYRKPDGKLGFNSVDLLGNLPGSLSSSSGADPGHMAAPQRDSVYLYQLQFANPCALTDETFHVTKIIDHASVSRKAFAELQKLGLIKADSGEVDTAAFGNAGFGRNFTHALSMIPVSRQRQLVDFLFWWDDETRRLHKLLDERQELSVMKDTEPDAAQRDRLLLLLNRVQMKIATRPSQRNPAMERDEDLPGIEAVTSGAQQGADTGAAGDDGREALPAYRS